MESRLSPVTVLSTKHVHNNYNEHYILLKDMTNINRYLLIDIDIYETGKEIDIKAN